eukprot:PhF_6_TR30438/c0_g1_i2/m.44685
MTHLLTLKFVLVFVVCTQSHYVLKPTTVTINNTQIRLDKNSNGVNAHDGNLLFLDDGKYWLFGTGYPDCLLTQDHCGWGNGPWGQWGDNNYAAYSSFDLVHWKLENPSLLPPQVRPHGTYFRPKVISAPHNPPDRRYVLWGNYVNSSAPTFTTFYFSAVSATPQGPYTIVNWNITLGSGWVTNGDFNVFVDDDLKGYIVYHGYGCPYWPGVPHTPCTGLDGSHAVDVLTADYTASTLQTSGLFDIAPTEAPIMFKRNGTYYIFTATGCGFCTEGSSVWVYMSTNTNGPLGPYTYMGLDLNPCATPPPSSNATLPPNCGVDPNNAPHVIPAQQAFVLKLPQVDAAGKEQWVWGSDLWNSAPDGLKSHELQSWQLLKFDGVVPLPLKNDASIKLIV